MKKYISVFTGFLASFVILSSVVGVGIFMNWNSPDFKASRTVITSIYFSSVGAILITMIYVVIKRPFAFKKLETN